MINPTITPAGLAAFAANSEITYTKFVLGSGNGGDDLEIDDAEQDMALSSVQVYLQGQTYTLDGQTFTPSYSHVKIIGQANSSDAVNEYLLTEIALMASIDGGDPVTFAYGADSNYNYPVNPQDSNSIVFQFDMPFSTSPQISIITSETGVTYPDFLNHVGKGVTAGAVHGLLYNGDDLVIGGSPADFAKGAMVRNSLGIIAAYDSLPPSADNDKLAYLKTDGKLYRYDSDSSQWFEVYDYDRRVKAVEDNIIILGQSSFPVRQNATAYLAEDICLCPGFRTYKYLECVTAGTSDSSAPAEAAVGALVMDGTAVWIVCDFRDSAPVGTVRGDYVARPGWIKADGSTVNRADYPRLWAWAVANLLTVADNTSLPGNFGEGDGTTTFVLPDWTDRMVQFASTAGTVKVAGLPDITGTFRLGLQGTDSYPRTIDSSGAFSSGTTTGNKSISGVSTTTSTNSYPREVGFSASASNSIYGSSLTVQPPAITLAPYIKF